MRWIAGADYRNDGLCSSYSNLADNRRLTYWVYIMKRKNVQIVAVDLFCGAGGLTHGLLAESITVRAGFDIDSACQYAYEKNNGAPFIIKDVVKIKGKEINTLFGKSKTRLLAGCAPCQPFSKYTQGKDTKADQKWSMLYEFARLVKEAKPEIVTMENVPQLIKHEVYQDFVSQLEALKYKVWTGVVFCPDYGIPQTRHRLVLLASRLGNIALIPPTHSKEEYKTVKETIGRLPKIKHGERSRHDRLHISSTLSDLNFNRIMASKPDGSWLDWDSDLIAACHKKPGRTTYRSVYGRMSWKKPSPTITTQFIGFGNGRFGHPEQHRALSLREGALLQTFPEQYEFIPPKNPIVLKRLARMIGNAVPVKLGEVIGKSIVKHVEGLNK